MKYYKTIPMLLSGLAVLACGGTALGQSSDALIDKLVQKGILSVKEANDLRDDTDKDFSKAYSAKNGMSDWVRSFKINGDFRGRADDLATDNLAGYDRLRFRYRLRVGMVASMADDFEVGLRLGSGDPSSVANSGGNPLSGNSTMQSDGSKKFLYIDTAYAKWTPIHTGDLTLGGTIGKMENPLETTGMVFDPDYTPEGVAMQSAYNLTDKHTLRFNGGWFVLNELTASSKDPGMGAAQLLWDAKWTPKISTTAGMGILGINHKESLGSSVANLPNQNTGNTRNVTGNLVNNYNPVVADASVTYKLASFPFYTGEFPIKLAGEFIDNPCVDKKNTGYWAGVTFGKAGTKHNWDVTYRYEELQSDAWWEEVVDDDNVGYYQTQLNSDAKTGYVAGTGIRGHMVKANYSFTQGVSMGFTAFVNERIDAPSGQLGDARHFMVDLSFKF